MRSTESKIIETATIIFANLLESRNSVKIAYFLNFWARWNFSCVKTTSELTEKANNGKESFWRLREMTESVLPLTRLIAQVNRRLESSLSSTLKEKGLSLEHFRILTALAEEDGRTMSDLAAWALVDPPTMTKMVDRLVSAGSVYRAPSPTDRRKVLVFISDHGRELQAGAAKPVESCESEVFESIAAGDRAELSRILRTLAN
nr:MarR family transcriptional regulator [Celeribacter sp. PS-C1]